MAELANTAEIHALAPWDAQLLQMKVSPEGTLIGLSYFDTGLRESYGITVAILERGRKKILAPGRLEKIYPGDRLFVIGNEEQIGRSRELIERTTDSEPSDPLSLDFGLEFFVLNDAAPVVGKSVRDSGLRERVQGLSSPGFTRMTLDPDQIKQCHTVASPLLFDLKRVTFFGFTLSLVFVCRKS